MNIHVTFTAILIKENIFMGMLSSYKQTFGCYFMFLLHNFHLPVEVKGFEEFLELGLLGGYL